MCSGAAGLPNMAWNASAAQLARRCFVTRQSLRLTAAGRERLRHSTSAVAEVEAAMTQGLPSAAIAELGALLMRCAENLDHIGGGGGI